MFFKKQQMLSVVNANESHNRDIEWHKNKTVTVLKEGFDL